MKKILKGKLLLLTVLSLFAFASMASAADLQPSSWSKSGLGTTNVSLNNDGDLSLFYELVSPEIYDVNGGEWWTFESTAKTTETFDYDWTYNVIHSWFRAYAKVITYAYGPNGVQEVTLFDSGIYGDVQSSGTSSLNLMAGYKYGFKVYGSNYDYSQLARGTLTIKENTIPVTFDLKPDALNLGSKSDKNSVTGYIEVPASKDVSAIDVASIQLDVNGQQIPAQVNPTGLGDYDQDGIQDLTVKFEKELLINALQGSQSDAEITVTGKLNNVNLLGKDTIKVIVPKK